MRGAQRARCLWSTTAHHLLSIIKWGPSSTGTETPIQQVSGQRHGLSATNRLPLLHQHRPSVEHMMNGSAVGHGTKALARQPVEADLAVEFGGEGSR